MSDSYAKSGMQECARPIQEPAVVPKFVLELRVADGVVDLGPLRRSKLNEASTDECAALFQIEELQIESAELDRARPIGSFVTELRAAAGDLAKAARVERVLKRIFITLAAIQWAEIFWNLDVDEMCAGVAGYRALPETKPFHKPRNQSHRNSTFVEVFPYSTGVTGRKATRRPFASSN